MAEPDLAHRRIVVPESRELDLFASMLEARGAETLRCPLVAIRDAEDLAPVEAWLRRLAAGSFDDLVLLTGEGLRRLIDLARELDIETPCVQALGRLRTITRGPKPARVLRDLGLAATLPAPVPTTTGVIAALTGLDLAGRRVGVQLYPGNPNAALMDFLTGRGARPDAVLPYRYASDADTGAVETVIRELAAGRVDVIAFTSSPQLVRLREVAAERGLETPLHDGLGRTRIAAIGPIMAAAIKQAGYTVAIAPAAFHMKPLVNAISDALKGIPSS